MPLQTKIQYKNYEPAEFTDKKSRTYEQTVLLIEAFPWEEQRDHLIVGPTGPSVTIEGDNNNFLKLALFYEGRFVLCYLDDKNRIFTKSLAHYKDAYPYIESFFTSSLFDPKDFKPEHMWARGKGIHFKDLNFHYTLNKWGSLLYWAIIAFMGGTSLALMIQMILSDMTGLQRALTIFLPGIGLGLAAGFLWLIVRHYNFAKNKLLIVSRGNEVFYFGDKDAPEKFEKKDIRELIF